MSETTVPEQSVGIKSRGTVTIDVEHCKGCELCIPACPPGVLAMSTAVNHMGYRYPELYAGCTGCNHMLPDKDQVCGPYSSVLWLPS